MGTKTTRDVTMRGPRIRYSESGKYKVYLHLVEKKPDDENNEREIEFLLSCTEDELTANFNALTVGRVLFTTTLVELLEKLKTTQVLDHEE